MLNVQTKNNLFDIYFIVRKKQGWLADCVQAGFDKAELDFLEQLDDELKDYDPEKEIEEWVTSVERDGGHEVHFEENADEKIKILSKKIADIYRQYEESRRNDEPYLDRLIVFKLSKVEQLEKMRRGIRGRQLHTQDKGEGRSDRITDADIESARAFPLEKLIPDFDMSRGGYIVCRWHADKRPSMLIKNGFGYCFSCGVSVDSIKWLIEVENMKFVDAVKALRGAR